MKNSKNTLLYIIMIVTVFLLVKFLTDDTSKNFAIVMALIVLPIFATHLILRKKQTAKKFFMSKWNIFTSKFKKEEFLELAPGLLMEKFEEVIKESKFKIVSINKDTNEIFATTPTTLNSWGENIYIKFIETETGSIFKFESSTFFGIIDGGKNEKNHTKILTEFDESLTI
jgi:hypothetical protein